MENTQHDRQVAESSSSAEAEGSRTTEGPAQTVARLLANPRRIRRA